MSGIVTGGPAFPCRMPDLHEKGTELFYPGMSLRAWFAGLAMQGLLASSHLYKGEQETFEEARERIVFCAYQYADGMLEHSGHRPNVAAKK